MKKTILVFITFFAINNVVNAQDFSLIGRVNGSVGLEYESLNYNGGSLAYSPGGGMGIEVGAEYEFLKGFSAYGTLGYQYHLAIQLESGTNGSNKSSFTFSRTFLTLGVNKFIKFSDNVLHGITLGAGGNYNIPGRLKITENDVSQEAIKYDSGIGFHLDARLRLKLSDKFFLEPGLRYRNLELEANSFGVNDVRVLPPNLRTLNASGVEISVSVIKKL